MDRERLIRPRHLHPAIHLDNRYRLMRHEPMLDADGKPTDTIGEDENSLLSMKQRSEDARGKHAYYGAPMMK